MSDRSLRRRESRDGVTNRAAPPAATVPAAAAAAPAWDTFAAAAYYTRSHSNNAGQHKADLKVSAPIASATQKGGSPGRVRTLSLLPPNNKMTKRVMLESFQPWVLQTYGDAAKTKTITRRKYARILKTLRGEDANNAENSKFRFWVKAKGFRLDPPPGYPTEDKKTTSDPPLYVPTATIKDGSGREKQVFKKVAVVENFFDIIYEVHVETEGKGGKHAGQKRTYRAVTETYAFLPREAVTKFLLQCTECQRRATASERSSGSESPAPPLSPNQSAPAVPDAPGGGTGEAAAAAAAATWERDREGRKTPHPPDPRRMEPPDINFSLPITTTYLKRMRSLGYPCPGDEDQYRMDVDQDNMSTADVDTGTEEDNISVKGEDKSSRDKGVSEKNGDWTGYQALGLKKMTMSAGNGDGPTTGNGSSLLPNPNGVGLLTKDQFREQSSPMSVNERTGQEAGSMQDETSSNGNKEDDDDDDDESEDKIDTQQYDPERLKAFNMFVRLFVDENLDRMVPISKQPKEKIQAIIDSCTRQFPEFSERARKRIRTYLKSCRRNKRSREANGWELTRPTPAHLTSVQAEQILAQACENESQNAKRMRMGLEPVSQPMPLPLVSWLGLTTSTTITCATTTTTTTTTPTTTNASWSTKSQHTSPPPQPCPANPCHSDFQGLLQLNPPSSPKVAKTAESAHGHGHGHGHGGHGHGQQHNLLTLMQGDFGLLGGRAAPSATSSTSSLLPNKKLKTEDTSKQDKERDRERHPDRDMLKSWSLGKIWAERPLESSVEKGSKGEGLVADGHGTSLPTSVLGGKLSGSERSGSLGDFRSQNGSALPLSMYQSPFNQAFSRAAAAAAAAAPPFPSPMFPSPTFSTAGVINSGEDMGPTDLSMKSKPLLNHKLNPTEIATVRQLITGYRESAAFLLRSADELEQLLIQQQ